MSVASRKPSKPKAQSRPRKRFDGKYRSTRAFRPFNLGIAQRHEAGGSTKPPVFCWKKPGPALIAKARCYGSVKITRIRNSTGVTHGNSLGQIHSKGAGSGATSERDCRGTWQSGNSARAF